MARGKVVRRARHTAKRLLRPVSNLLWREPLDRPATLDLLEGYRLDVNQDADVTLPVLDPASDCGRGRSAGIESVRAGVRLEGRDGQSRALHPHHSLWDGSP